jgi:hypothetical protein
VQQVFVGAPAAQFLAAIPVKDIALLLSYMLPHPHISRYERMDQLLAGMIPAREVVDALASKPFRAHLNHYLDTQVHKFAEPTNCFALHWVRFSDIFPADLYLVFPRRPPDAEVVHLYGRLYLSETVKLGEKYSILHDPLNYVALRAKISF